jgi:FkbM family methyltransferase
VKRLLQKTLNSMGLHLERSATHRDSVTAMQETQDLFQYILEKNGGKDSKSQLGQDVFALIETGFKRNGFFVEFGATDGVYLSNTYMLEKDFGWTGILAEPAPIWHSDLLKNRKCAIETGCVWSNTGETVSFDVTEEGEYSTLSAFSSSDTHSAMRKSKIQHQVQTISLFDLLTKHKAPTTIDYLSVDTEGSEFDILNSFDFSTFQFKVITVEHNYTDNRSKIHDLLTKNGYRRPFTTISLWDDWYVAQS